VPILVVKVIHFWFMLMIKCPRFRIQDVMSERKIDSRRMHVATVLPSQWYGNN